MLGLMALGPALKGWVDVVRWFKGDSLDTSKLATKEELAHLTANSKKELEAAERRLQKQQEQAIAQVTGQVSTFTETAAALRKDLAEIFTELRSLHRALGRAEGVLEAESHDRTKPR
jgi:septal ring factor EnvC (AmiA/AmiB activator)